MPPFAASFCRALGFATRLPAPKRAWENAPPLSADCAMFPLAACVPAACAALILGSCAALGLSPLAAALCATAALTMLTGALHEDGLADCADGFFTQKPALARLKIMHDSRLGTYGGCALFFALALRSALAAACLQKAGIWIAAAALLGAEAGSRGLMIYLWRAASPAAAAGIVAAGGRPSLSVTAAGTGAAAALAALFILPFAGIAAFLSAAFCALIGLCGFARLAQRKLGGINGDCLGAAQQIGVIALLFGQVLCL